MFTDVSKTQIFLQICFHFTLFNNFAYLRSFEAYISSRLVPLYPFINSLSVTASSLPCTEVVGRPVVLYTLALSVLTLCRQVLWL